MNNHRALFLASFFTLIAAGVGFAVRGAILADWGADYGFTKQELGGITGGGLVGFGITILICSFIADTVGYKPLMVLAFLLHIASYAVTVAAGPVFEASGKDAAYWCLYVGAFLFALANGVCESVINPLVATLYPGKKTHYLNILHAGWPGGLIIGGLLAYAFCGRDAAIEHLPWEVPTAFFLLPTLYYGYVILREKFPESEASAAGVSFGEMLAQFASPILLMLLLLHALVGYVELGTDSWITDIQKALIQANAVLLFVWTSGVMFVLRFFAGPIVERINPVGLLFLSAVIGASGLYWLGSTTAGLSIFLAATVYGVGKTFLWPTMLGVVGERYPRGGALVMGSMGAAGMISAGLIGAPMIGYKQDYFAAQKLQELSPEVYDRYKAAEPKRVLIMPPIAGLDGSKVGDLKDKIKDKVELTAQEAADKDAVLEADIYGGRMALKWTAIIPATMAVGYLILVLYFASTGGYKVEHLHTESSTA